MANELRRREHDVSGREHDAPPMVLHNGALLSMETIGWGEDPLATPTGQAGAAAAAVCAVALVGLIGRGRADSP